MKEKRRILTPNFDELIVELVSLWRRFLKVKGGGPQDRLHTREFRSVCEEIKKLQRNFTSFENRESLAAYMLYYFPLHYAEGLSLLSELPKPPNRVLDLFCGPGPFSLAALQHGASEVIGLDESADALRIGSEIIGRLGYTFTQRVWNHPKPIPAGGKFDLIILGHAPTFLESCFDYLTDDGYLLIVDSSWPDANKRLLKLRDSFVEKDYSIIAPCVYKGACPALLAGEPCFAQREFKKPFLMREIQRACDINLSSLKMSYLIVSKKELSLPKEPLYRVVSPSLQTRFGKRYYLCGTDGYKALGSRLSEHPKTSRAFEFLQRGDLISIQNPLVSKDTLEIIEDTQVSIEAAAGKPVSSSS